MPEVVRGVGVFGVLHQFRKKNVGIEEVDAHRGVDHVGVEGRANVGGLRLLDKPCHFAIACDLNDAEAGDFIGRDRERSQGNFGAGVVMLLQHPAIVHLVDVVARKDQDMLRLFRADGVDILINGIGSPLVPGLRNTLHRRQDFDELAQLVGNHRPPAFANVAIQRERLVLGEDVDVAQVGVDAVGKSDVDNAVLTGERDGGLGAIASEREKSFTSSTCEQHAECISHGPLPRIPSAT